MSPLTSREKGNAAEQAAADYLSARGYRIRQRNYRLKTGEIDIICEKDGYLIFVEVKASSSRYQGAFPPCGRVDYRKQQRILHTAQEYLRRAGAHQDYQPRFDVIEVLMDPAYRQIRQINHLANAFPR